MSFAGMFSRHVPHVSCSSSQVISYCQKPEFTNSASGLPGGGVRRVVCDSRKVTKSLIIAFREEKLVDMNGACDRHVESVLAILRLESLSQVSSTRSHCQWRLVRDSPSDRSWQRLWFFFRRVSDARHIVLFCVLLDSAFCGWQLRPALSGLVENVVKVRLSQS